MVLESIQHHLARDGGRSRNQYDEEQVHESRIPKRETMLDHLY